MGAFPSEAPRSAHSSTNGPDESDESERCHDSDAGLRLRRRDMWTKTEGCEGCDRRHRQRRRRPVEKERFLQARWRIEHEAQEETRSSSSQGCEPLHERAVRLQSEASKQDGPGFADEEAQGDDQLRQVGDSICSAAIMAAVGGPTRPRLELVYFQPKSSQSTPKK